MSGANLIGTGPDGATLLSNGGSGIRITGGAQLSTIGRTDWSPNIIAGNGTHGIFLQSAGIMQDIYSNLIHSNSGNGIAIDHSIGSDIKLNEITGNGAAGVQLTNSQSEFINITMNSIYDNGGKGIDLGSGGNQALAAPVIQYASASEAYGQACPACRVEIFSDAADEGRVYQHSAAADPWTGDWYYSGPLDGPYITTTNIDGPGNTSEFSEPWSLAPTPTETPTATPTVSATPTASPTSTVTPACWDDEFEDNDSCATAHNLSAGPYPCLTLCSGDDDWYAIGVPFGGSITAQIDFTGSAGNLDLQLVGPDCTMVLDTSSGGGDTEEVFASHLYGGDYHVRVYGVDSAENQYDLALGVSGPPKPTPADTATATATPAATQSVTPTPSHTPTPTRTATPTVPLASTPTPSATPTLTPTTSASATPTATPTQLPPCVDDWMEENDTCENAGQIGPGLYPGLQVCLGDEDWFSIDMRAGETMTFTATFLHVLGNLNMTLSTGDCEHLLATSFTLQDFEQIIHEAAVDQQVRLKVDGWKGGEENAYGLLIDVDPPARGRANLLAADH